MDWLFGRLAGSIPRTGAIRQNVSFAFEWQKSTMTTTMNRSRVTVPFMHFLARETLGEYKCCNQNCAIRNNLISVPT